MFGEKSRNKCFKTCLWYFYVLISISDWCAIFWQVLWSTICSSYCRRHWKGYNWILLQSFPSCRKIKMWPGESTINWKLVVLYVDLQQVLHSYIQACSIRGNSSVNNLAVHNLETVDVTMTVWHNCTGKRRSAEIFLCILKYVLDCFASLTVISEERTLIIWSDRCVGQNNWWVLAVCSYLVSKFSMVSLLKFTRGSVLRAELPALW